jgi:hypothetical protein
VGIVQDWWRSLQHGRNLEAESRAHEATVGVLSRALEESLRTADALREELITTRKAIGRTEVAERNTTLRDMKIRSVCVACGGNMRAGEDCAHCFMGAAEAAKQNPAGAGR